MDKGRQPNVYACYDTASLFREAFELDEREATLTKLEKVLGVPDYVETITRCDPGIEFFDRLNTALSVNYDCNLGPTNNLLEMPEISAELFRCHDVCIDESYLLAMRNYSLAVALNVYSKGEGGDESIGKLLLFKMRGVLLNGSAKPNNPNGKLTAKDLSWGKNCASGVLIRGNDMRFLQLLMSDEEVVQSELRRKDSTEESGETVDARVVKKGFSYPIIEEIDPDDVKVKEMRDELNKFTTSRLNRFIVARCVVQSQNQ